MIKRLELSIELKKEVDMLYDLGVNDYEVEYIIERRLNSPSI